MSCILWYSLMQYLSFLLYFREEFCQAPEKLYQGKIVAVWNSCCTFNQCSTLFVSKLLMACKMPVIFIMVFTYNSVLHWHGLYSQYCVKQAFETNLFLLPTCQIGLSPKNCSNSKCLILVEFCWKLVYHWGFAVLR